MNIEKLHFTSLLDGVFWLYFHIMKDLHLIISRKKEYFNFVRPFKVYVDGFYVGSLKNGQTKMSLIKKRHTVKIAQSLSFFRSKEYHIEGTAESPVCLEPSTGLLGTTDNVLLLFFILLYWPERLL